MRHAVLPIHCACLAEQYTFILGPVEFVFLLRGCDSQEIVLDPESTPCRRKEKVEQFL